MVLSAGFADAQSLLIPMDSDQTNHLKAYGLAYWTLEQYSGAEWLLNYRGGSFLLPDTEGVRRQAALRGVSIVPVTGATTALIRSEIANSNMETVVLEKAPRIAIYTPPNSAPWDDAVTMALEYSDIPYETVWDPEVIGGQLSEFEWLHLHHEDFTGQYGKFYRSYHNSKWYRDQQRQYEEMAQGLGFPSVHEEKKSIARSIKAYVGEGGFLFAMCSATDSYDIALAMENIDGAHAVFDGTPINPKIQSKLDFSKTFAFTEFKLFSDPMIYEFSDIDYPSNKSPNLKTAEQDYFTLFEFSAKWDPVPTMLTQDQVAVSYTHLTLPTSDLV